MSIKLGTQDIAGISTHTNVNAHSLFDFKWADHRLNEVSWLEASTFSWQSGDVYVTAYNHLVADLQGITAETETVGSYTVTFYRATDGHKICLADQEQTVLNIYNESGIAWYYIVDDDNARFKLPRTKFGFEGLRGNVGDKIDEKLPNITATMAGDISQASSSGAIAITSAYNGAMWYGSTSVTRMRDWDFNASRSSSAYQDGAPVQERATQMYLYFYVGDYSQTAIEQTAGLNSELFNGKADTDLNNMNASQTAKDTIVGWGIPDMTAGVGWYYNGTAVELPCDALVTVTAQGGGNWVGIGLYVNGNLIVGNASIYSCSASMVLPKGSRISGDATYQYITYYPLKGVN